MGIMNRTALIGPLERRAWMVGVLLAAMSGCGARSAVLLPGQGGDSGVSRDARVVADRGVDGSRPKSQGIVLLAEVTDAVSAAQQGTVLASFTPAPHSFFEAKLSLGGGCAVYIADPRSKNELSAGVITVKGAPLDIRLEPYANPIDEVYPSILFDELVSAGRELEVSAEGADVRSFSGIVRGVDAPKPRLPSIVRRDRDAVLFVESNASRFWVVLQQGEDESVRCDLTLTPQRALIVPRAALGYFAPESRITLAVAAYERSTIALGDASIELLTMHAVAQQVRVR
jgi:predicted Rdx family selenoprotein